jgi:hypothetical protein
MTQKSLDILVLPNFPGKPSEIAGIKIRCYRTFLLPAIQNLAWGPVVDAPGEQKYLLNGGVVVQRALRWSGPKNGKIKKSNVCRV